MLYNYWVVRYVPNIARGEFTNIGLVVGSDAADWATRFETRNVPNPGMLRSDLRELSSWVHWFKARVAAYSATTFEESSVSRAWLDHLRARQANSVQFSEPLPIEAESAEQGLSLLFPHLIEREHPRRTRAGVTRKGMRTAIRDLYQYELDYLPGRTLFLQPRMTVGRQRGTFDLARTEPSGPILTNTWTFNAVTLDHLERDIQSWNYLVSRFRSDGGDATLDATEKHLEGHEPIEAVYVKPTVETNSSWRAEIFEAALEAWRLADVQAVQYNDYIDTHASIGVHP